MAGERERFFEEISKQGHVRLLERTSGVLLIEIKDGERAERWFVTIHRGDIGVAHDGAAPDCVIRTDGATFDAIVTGKMSTMPAILRNKLEVEGRIELVLALQTMFKPTEGAIDQRTAGYARRSS